MLEGRADIAVHSMKDVPAELPDGFGIEIVLAREDPRDTLISAGGSDVDGLAQGACVGTSSLRRRSQLLAVRPDLDVIDLRGNVPTRLQRFYDGQYDAIVLAAAGLIRLDKMIDQACPLPVQDMLPAVGQGAIGIECRQDDDQLLALLASLHHSPTATCVAAERRMNARLGGSCQVPIAGHAELAQGQITLHGLVASADGSQVVNAVSSGPAREPGAVGEQVAEQLLASGAAEILAELGVDSRGTGDQ